MLSLTKKGKLNNFTVHNSSRSLDQKEGQGLVKGIKASSWHESCSAITWQCRNVEQAAAGGAPAGHQANLYYFVIFAVHIAAFFHRSATLARTVASFVNVAQSFELAKHISHTHE